MKKHYTLYNIGKLLILSCVLLLGGTEVAMGQGRYTIEPQDGKTFPQENVPELVYTVYMEQNAERDLVISELATDELNNADGYKWYVRWYRIDGNKNPIANSVGTVLKTKSTRQRIANSNQSIFWHNGCSGGINDAAAITYHKPIGTDNDIVICDISPYTDGWSGNSPSGNSYTFTEPTISKRYRFIIKSSDEIKKRLDQVEDNDALETIQMTVPKGATNVNLQIPLEPEDYFWEENNQGASFIYSINDDSREYPVDANNNMISLDDPISQQTTIKVFARTNNNRETSPCIVKFIITTQDNAALKLEANIQEDEYRNPGKSKRYEEIAHYDFDLDNSIEGGSIDLNNNISKKPLDAEYTTYGFAHPTLKAITGTLTPKRNHYGLYRSANKAGVSQSGDQIERDGRKYEWYFARVGQTNGKPTVYDRTYVNSNGAQSGFFYYIDASVEAGRIVNVPIDEQLCAGTQLTITAWVANLSDAPTRPNLNVLLRGVLENNEEEEIHRFSTGDPDKDYQGQWLQIFYNVTISQEQASRYESYKVEIQNNTKDSNGADYAFDDVRIYKTLPNISVRRESACDYSTLVVSSDYNTLMRNMGWSENPNVLANASLSDRGVRKYRYGIMGDDPYTNDPHEHVGNMYYSVTEINLDDPNSSGGSKLEDWVTLNKELLEKGESLNNETLKSLSKSMRVAIPTDLNTPNEGKDEHGEVPNNQADAAMNEIILNLRALNDFLSDTEPKQIYDVEGNPDGDLREIWREEELDEAKINTTELKKYLESVSTITKTDKITGKITITADQVRTILTDGEANQLYENWLIKVYDFLELPRIRCPWQKEDMDGDKILCLGALDVNNTDLKYKGEKGPNEEVGASGVYHVVVFNAEHVHNAMGAGGSEGSVVNFADKCLLHSPFTVQPSSNFAINTEMTHDGKGCLGSITHIKGNLLVDEVDGIGNIISEEPIPFEDAYGDQGSYTFDWFIGTLEEYNRYSNSVVDDGFMDLRGLIKAFRDTREGNETAYFTKEMIMTSEFYNNYKDDAELLIGLLGDATTEAKLIIGNDKNGSSIRWPECVVAMPYVPDIKDSDPSLPDENGKTYQFCVEPLELPLETNVAPTLSVGFHDINYEPDMSVVPLRLGLRNINDVSGNGIELKDIPIRQNIGFGSNGNSLGMPYGENDVIVYLNDNTSEFKPIANLTALKATDTEGGKLSIKFHDKVAQYFKEGQDEYRLYIPFGEYSDEKVIDGSCGGYAELTLKIVPEYLTWKGGTDAVWYNDNNWNQSTKADLYMGNKDQTDANGDDDVTNAFTPLYFTKITIPKEAVLSLYGGTLNPGDKATANIQYDMAVNNTGTGNSIEVVPYYGNKVEQIYFKPEAKLVNQHFLDYQKAWVEFEIKNNRKRWFASPLQDVYAGDFYAPKENGRQETVAFADIKYDTSINSRWAPAFYQKAWNSAINYATNVEGTTNETVAAVKSNWSIEYNDVTVSYPIGKGFYLSVEGNDSNGTALVRLPKADAVTDYKYEEAATKASVLRADEASKANSGKLAAYKNADGSLSNGNVTVKLSDLFGESADDITGEGSSSTKQHFLVGNPFMTYLDMSEFLSENKGLFAENKYWILENGSVKAVVGTPDVPFEDAYSIGTVEPMQAFFVELAENATVNETTTITFTPAMMSATMIAAGSTATKSASATNPVITLTAERGDVKSKASLLTYDKADNGYKADEDAVVLLDSELDAPMVYTVSGSKAAQVNAVKSIRNIGLGVYNETNDEVTLTIEGLSRLAEPLYLYDAHTRKSVKLEDDSYSLQVAGDSHGRYFLRDSELGSELENTISIYSARRGQVIVSSLRPVKEIKVFGLNGSQARQFSVNTTQYSFDLPAGIYMIHAGDGEQAHTEKVIVR